jgi:hypothetical protein
MQKPTAPPFGVPQNHRIAPQDKTPELPEGVDFVELIRQGTHFSQAHGDKIYLYHKKTGHLHVVLHRSPLGNHGQLVKKEMAYGPLYVEEEIPIATIGAQQTVQFTPLLIEEICQKITEGGSLKSICSTPGFPTYSLFCRWRREHAWIEKALEEARFDRAEYLRDELVEIADSAESIKDAAAKALRIEARKWSAGIDNQKYNPKAKVEVTGAVATQIIVHTGIVRDVTETQVGVIRDKNS